MNYVNLLRHIPASTCFYTFEITGTADTYLYVIDPRSVNLTKSNEYDDDSGEEYNAALTIALEKGVPYLIIFCGYNPSYEYGNTEISLLIS